MATRVSRNPESRRPPIRPALEAIAIKGFKSHRDHNEIAVRNLTLLAGENSGGKSSIIQPLLLMKQTLDATHDPGVLELNGDCVKLSNAADIFWNGRAAAGGPARRWSFALKVGGEWATVEYGLKSGGGIEAVSTQGQRNARTIVLTEGMDTSGIPMGQSPKLLAPTGYNATVEVQVERIAHAAELRVRSPSGPADRYFVMERWEPFPVHVAESLIHLPGLRGNPERAYPITRVTDRYPGRFHPYTASVLLTWKEKRERKLLNEVGRDLETLGMTWKVDTRKIGDAAVELRVGRLGHAQQGGAMDLVNVADVGFGASQVLPVVVALRVAAKGQLVHIEQPELHLHPNAQVKMAGLLLDAARRGVRIIVETHSSLILKAIQVAIAEDPTKATRDLVALHWFSRDSDGVSQVVTADLKPDGSYGPWPVDFADVELDIERRFIVASTQKVAQS